jgi:ubiquinone biosynthesis protein UbiJ
MYVRPKDLSGLVRNQRDAEVVIAELLTRFGGDTASERMVEEAQFSKQSVEETARRTASNLLTGFVTRRRHW